MSYQTISSAPPDAVTVEARPGGAASDVWLRKNIERDAAGHGEDDGAAVESWRADEVHFVSAGAPTADEVAASFDELWEAHEADGMTDSERLAQLRAALEDTNAALLEIGDLIGGE